MGAREGVSAIRERGTMAVSDKIMFEIYKESGYGHKYRVVYFTELEEHNKEAEITRAMAGEHLFDGFVADRGMGEAKQAISAVIDRLNDGEDLDEDRVSELLQPYIAD